MNELGYRLGIAGVSLGLVAGVVQWAFGDEIPDWTGNKLHPVGLGVITILLCLIALAGIRHLHRRPGASPRERVLATFGILLCAGICFTTVGRLWYVPGPLLIVAAFLLNRRSRSRPSVPASAGHASR